ncbi:MAG: DUF29 domain-containing protein [Spirulina sp. SIO3F2]|nr:DUF29 domain-containing protein [Spirulina sp. SIO3F2]
MPPVITLSLYEQDFVRWTEQTAKQLKSRAFDAVDWDNLIEEVEALGRSERRELQSRLLVLFEHALKRVYLPLPQEFNGWERTIRGQRIQLELLLGDSPSLKTRWEPACDRAWSLALKKVRGDYPQIICPDHCPFDIEPDVLLNQVFWSVESE